MKKKDLLPGQYEAIKRHLGHDWKTCWVRAFPDGRVEKFDTQYQVGSETEWVSVGTISEVLREMEAAAEEE